MVNTTSNSFGRKCTLAATTKLLFWILVHIFICHFFKWIWVFVFSTLRSRKLSTNSFKLWSLMHHRRTWLVHCLLHERCNYLCVSCVCVCKARHHWIYLCQRVKAYLQPLKYTAVMHSLKNVNSLRYFHFHFFFLFSFLLLMPQMNKHSRQQELLPDCSYPIWAATCGTKMKCWWLRRTRRLHGPNHEISSCCFWLPIRCFWKSFHSMIRTLTHKLLVVNISAMLSVSDF